MAKRKRKRAPALRRIVRRDGGAHDAARAVPVVPREPDAARRRRRRRGATQGIDLKKAKIVTIKTVVNVVYNTDAQNISDAQINSQIAALNKDFRATNPDKSRHSDAVARAWSPTRASSSSW